MSKEQELTPWFPADVKPERTGVYLATVSKAEVFYRRWDGERWCYGAETPEQAAEISRPWPWSMRDVPMYWRGLAKEPK